MQKSRKSHSLLTPTRALLVLFVVIGVLMVISMFTIISTSHRYKNRRNGQFKLADMDSTNVMMWQFTLENIKREPDILMTLSTYLLNEQSLTSLKLKSPGIREETTIDFFSANPGWLSQRTFTADVFTCPPNSHEGLTCRPQRPCCHQKDPKSFKIFRGLEIFSCADNRTSASAAAAAAPRAPQAPSRTSSARSCSRRSRATRPTRRPTWCSTWAPTSASTRFSPPASATAASPSTCRRAHAHTLVRVLAHTHLRLRAPFPPPPGGGGREAEALKQQKTPSA